MTTFGGGGWRDVSFKAAFGRTAPPSLRLRPLVPQRPSASVFPPAPLPGFSDSSEFGLPRGGGGGGDDSVLPNPRRRVRLALDPNTATPPSRPQAPWRVTSRPATSSSFSRALAGPLTETGSCGFGLFFPSPTNTFFAINWVCFFLLLFCGQY